MGESRDRSLLRAELARVRDHAELSTRKLGELLGVTYATITRYEHGPTLPTLSRTRKWLDACGVADPDRGRILDLADRARSQSRSWSELLEGENPQVEFRQIEQDAVLIRSWCPVVMPGVLQAVEYAMPVMQACWTSDLNAGLQARMQRQNDLYSSLTRHHYLVSEYAWRAPWASPQVVAAQQARAISLAQLDNVTLGVVPDSVLTAPAWHGFDLFTSSAGVVTVVRELVDGLSIVGGVDSVQRHETVWRHLQRSAEKSS